MYYSFVLVGLLFIVNGYSDSIEDRYYFDLILRVLQRYPILKQTFIHLCSKELDKCKSNRILRAYTNLIDDEDLQQILDNLIDCFIDSQICLQNDNWEQWSEWSSCSVTCGTGRIVRTRSCKSDRQCLIDSFSTQSNYCFANSCINNYEKYLTTIKSVEYKSIENKFNIIFIFLFPILFTLLCIPLCVFYYIYEFDFKIHALIIHFLSICNRHCGTKKRRINISR